jgi:hypothetical protein
MLDQQTKQNNDREHKNNGKEATKSFCRTDKNKNTGQPGARTDKDVQGTGLGRTGGDGKRVTFETDKKRDCPPQPKWRAMLGAMILMAVKGLTYREAEDYIAHYAPARFLCGLTDTDWTPDHVSIFELTQQLGPEGMEQINKHIIGIAIKKGFADPSALMSDTTAQEAKIPYPNEIGLMSRYAEKMKQLLKKAGVRFSKARKLIREKSQKVKAIVRAAHLFCKDANTKARAGKKLKHIILELHRSVKEELDQYRRKVRGKAEKELVRMTNVMDQLLPQICFFLETGFVAPKKIIHLVMNELYSIVRGKSGKKVEFGLKWGISRLRGGFINGFLLNGGQHKSDIKFCLEAIKKHIAEFGKAPRDYGFDRGGHSPANVKKAKKFGVKNVGIAPKGKQSWAVSENKRKEIVKERAQVEGLIGTVKKPLYGFNKPDARSIEAMGICGQRSFVGFNLRKIVREMVKMELASAKA